MREVLFRGKGINTGEWRYGNFVVENWTSKIVTNTGEKFSVVTATVGQYTEVDDVDGNKIFEGDIVSHEGTAYKVFFDKEDAGFYLKYFAGVVRGIYDDVVVIGNTTDNPDFLREEE
jgi:hypothetical protein